jgi:transposase
MGVPTSPVDLPLHPTSASWLNAVESFFAKLTKRRLKRFVFLSVVDSQSSNQSLRRRTQRRTETSHMDC